MIKIYALGFLALFILALGVGLMLLRKNNPPSDLNDPEQIKRRYHPPSFPGLNK